MSDALHPFLHPPLRAISDRVSEITDELKFENEWVAFLAAVKDGSPAATLIYDAFLSDIPLEVREHHASSRVTQLYGELRICKSVYWRYVVRN